MICDYFLKNNHYKPAFCYSIALVDLRIRKLKTYLNQVGEYDIEGKTLSLTCDLV